MRRFQKSPRLGRFLPNIWKRSAPPSPPSTKRSPPPMRKARSVDCLPAFRAIAGKSGIPDLLKLERSPPRSPPARQSRVFSSRAATFPLGSGRRPGKIPVAARKSSAPSPNRATAPSGGCSCPAEQSRQAIAEARHRWFARSGQAERLASRDWLVALLARKPARLVTVALANQLARIIGAVMTRSEAFRTATFAQRLSNQHERAPSIN
jgi:hypothetical protein